MKDPYDIPEEDEQAAVIEWRDLMVKTGEIPELWNLYHTPNEGYSGKKGRAKGIKLKRLGVLPGVCDLFWPLSRGGYHGLYVEMKKTGGGDLTPKQLKFIQQARSNGYAAEVAHGREQAITVILNYYNLRG